MPDIHISRQPLVNRQSKIIAIRLRLHLGEGATAEDAAAVLDGLQECWPQEEKLVFVSVVGAPVDASVLEWPVPENAVIEIPGAALAGSGAADLVAALQGGTISLCLGVDEHAKTALTSGLKFRFIGFDAQRHTLAQLKVMAAQTQSFGIPIAFNVPDGPSFNACLEAGLSAAASWFFTNPSKPAAKALNPGQAQIIRIMNLVRKNADVREIEAALKQDVALSYKLLRYINSAGFGLSCEIQSFRHAVTILGYEKLNKWLSLLLATASKDPMAPALLHTSLTRARLMEVLSHGLVDRQEYDNLFITGAFSMLEPLLGVSMESILESMSLPESISDALLGRGGMYGPFLDLARASEGEDAQALAEQVMMLGLMPEQFNRAQLQALAFAGTMEL
ncbi:EAL and HDOD domain-containing protein [Propionivibrio limicola]|uniref:EAL and HDOD domain-containing protein n=1 Tax=Propionivibrio limicola TaxID=167645 RepID=UPI001290C622|nr:HDOD domain-containing protein [Propionivibrio limicola]